MKPIWIGLLSIGVAASLCGCAAKPAAAVDPLLIYNASRHYQSLEQREQGLKERWLAQGQ